MLQFKKLAPPRKRRVDLATWCNCTLLRGWAISLTTCAASAAICAQELPSTLVSSSARNGASNSVLPVVSDLESFEIRLTPLSNQPSAPVVTALAASHDGRFLAAAGDDHAIRIIDVASGKTFSTLIGHTDWIQSLVFTSDSQNLYSAANDGRVLKWNHQYPVSFTQVLKRDYALRAITLSTEKGLLAACGFSDNVLIWDLGLGKLRHDLRCESQDQRCVRFSPDGTRLLRGGRLGEICVWDTESGEEIASYREHKRRVFTAAFSADGTEVTSVGEDRRLVRTRLADKSVLFDKEVAQGKLMSMCLINDDMVAAAGADNSIILFDLLAGESVAQLSGHTGTVAVMVPCGELLASGSFDTTIRIWNLEQIGQRRVDYGKPVHAPMKMDASLQIR